MKEEKGEEEEEKKEKESIKVSVVIVCMNNLQNLLPCLDSIIQKNLKIPYEIIVVAYLFSEENIEILKKTYPNVKIIISNEIRGFSENNNLALREVESEFSFILNDDTIMNMPVIDLLFDSYIKQPDAVIFSPKILNNDSTVQFNGRPPIGILEYFLSNLKINYKLNKNQYVDQKGIFKTFNICGAAFMIRTEKFKQLGYFDEQYFFTPEDIALSTLANQKKFYCYVNENVTIIHKQGESSNKLISAIYPSIAKGNIQFYGNSFLNKVIIRLMVFSLYLFKSILYFIVNEKEKSKANYNAAMVIFLNKSAKDVFLHFYNKL